MRVGGAIEGGRWRIRDFVVGIDGMMGKAKSRRGRRVVRKNG